MSKIETLIVIGTLEVRFEGQEKLLNELAKLEKYIVEDDYVQAALAFGRLKEMVKLFDISIDDCIDQLYKYISKIEEKMAREKILNMPIEKLNFSVRTYNCLKRVGLSTGRDLAKIPVKKLRQVPNMTSESIEEIVTILREHGIELKE